MIRPRPGATRGRPRKKGPRWPSAWTIRPRPGRPFTVAWYGGSERTIRIATGTAVWYHSGKPPVAIRWVLITDPGTHPFAPQALLSTDPNVDAQQIVAWFVQRWQVDVTLEESGAHLGIETQRQWSEQAIARTTPVLLGLFSLVTLLAQQFLQGGSDAPAHRRLVHEQAAADLLGYPGLCAAAPLARCLFWDIPGKSRCHRNSVLPV